MTPCAHSIFDCQKSWTGDLWQQGWCCKASDGMMLAHVRKRFPTANTSPDIFACGCCCHIVGRDQGCYATKCPAAVCASLAKVEKPWSRALSKVLRGLKCQARQQCFIISGSIIVGFTIYGVKKLVLEFCKSNSRDWGTVAPDLISWNEWTSGYSNFCNLVSHLVGSFQALACVDLILTAPFL